MATNTNRPSRLADETLDALRNAPANVNTDVSNTLKEAEEKGEKSEFLASFREKFRSLNKEVQQQISTNLEQLSSRSTSRQLEMLKVEVDALKMEKNTETKVDTAVKKEKGFFGGFVESVKDSDVNPQNWSEKTRSTAKGVGVATVAAATAYGVFRFTKWFFTGAKKVKVKAAESAKRGTAKATLIVALGLAAAASFVGWKVLEKSIFGQLNQKVADAEVQLKIAKENARKVQEQIQAMPGQISESMQLQQQEVLQKLETAQRKRDDLIDAIAKRADDAEAQKVKEEEQKKKKEEEQDRQKAEQEEKDAASLVDQINNSQTRSQLLATGILFLHPAPPNSFQNVHFHDAIEMLADKKNMGEIFSMIAPDGTVTLTDDIVYKIQDRGDAESRTRAVEHLFYLCTRERDAVKIALQTSKKHSKISMDKLTLREYIDLFGAGTQSVLAIANRLKTFDGDIGKLANNTDFNEIFAESGELDPYIPELYERFTDETNPTHVRGAAELLTAAAQYGNQSAEGFLKDMLDKEKRGEELTTNEKVLQAICEEMKNDSPTLFVKPFFHGLSPYTDAPADSIESVRHIIEQRMPISLVTRMYVYRRMVQDKKVSGILLAQADIARYFAKPPYTMGWEDIMKHSYRVGKLTSRVSGLATTKGWGEFMGYMEEGDITIPPEMWSNATKMAKTLAIKGGTGIGSAVMGILYSAGAGFGFLSEHKTETAAGTFLAGWGVRQAVKGSINGTKIKIALSEWASNVEGKEVWWQKMPDDLYRKINRFAISETVLTSSAKNFSSVQDAYENMREISESNPKRWRKIKKMFNRAIIDVDDTVHWEKLAKEFARDGYVKASHAAENLAKSFQQRRALNIIRFYREQLWKKPFFLAARGVDFATAKTKELATRSVSGWRKANGWERAGYAAGVGLHALSLKGDIDEYYNVQEQTKAMHEHMTGTMRDLRAELSADPHFEKTGPYTFRHKTSGVEVSLHVPASVENMLGSRVDAQAARTAITGSALLTNVLMGAKTFSGPAGLAVVGVEVIARTGIESWQQGKVREFIADAPPWLLVQFGTKDSTGLSENDLLSKASTWMISDIFPSLDDADKKGIRTKMLYVMFNHDLGTYTPELLGEVYAGVENPLELDSFYKEDFSSIVLPAFSTFLFAGVRDDSVKWDAIKGQDIVSGGLLRNVGLDAAGISLIDVRKAMRLATTYYLQHIREKRYVTNLMALQEDRANAQVLYSDMQKSGEDVSLESLIDPDLKQLVSELGSVSVFGNKLDALPLQNEDFASYKTRAQRALELVQKHLDSTHGETRVDKQYNAAYRINAIQSVNPDLAKKYKMPNVFSVLPDEASGLDVSLDFSNDHQIFGFLTLAQQHQMEQMFAETFAEQKEEEGLLWNDWKGKASFISKQVQHNIMTPPSHITGVDSSSIQYSLLGAAVNNIRSELGLEKVHKGYENFFDALDTELGLLLGFGTAHSTRSTEANFRYLLTKSAADLLENPASAKVRERVRRNADVEHALYDDMPHQPIVLTCGSVDKKACMKLRYPDVDKKEFPPENLQAVLFEEDSLLKSGEYSSVTLATYIYGDIEQKKITVLQSSTATSMLSSTKLSRTTGSSNGLTLAYSAKEALRKPGMQAVLSQIPTALQEREIERMQARTDMKNLQNQQKEQAREWQEETAPKEFRMALEATQKKPDSYVRIGDSNQYLFYDSSRKQFLTFLPSDYGKTSVASAPKYAYGENRIKPSKERKNIIISHKSEEDALHFYVQKKTTLKLPKNTQEFRTLDELNMKYSAIKPYITQPVTRTKEDVYRIIDLADQIVVHPRLFGNTRFYALDLKNALGSFYEKLSTDYSRGLFLNELLQFLRTSKNTVDANTSSKIRTWFEQHPQMFERENW